MLGGAQRAKGLESRALQAKVEVRASQGALDRRAPGGGCLGARSARRGSSHGTASQGRGPRIAGCMRRARVWGEECRGKWRAGRGSVTSGVGSPSRYTSATHPPTQDESNSKAVSAGASEAPLCLLCLLRFFFLSLASVNLGLPWTSSSGLLHANQINAEMTRIIKPNLPSCTPSLQSNKVSLECLSR